MKPRELLDIISVAERLKDTTRHCYTSEGRRESVAEHTWMMTLIAFFLEDEFPKVNMNKVVKMCVIHDLGECFTGDIPTFDKTNYHKEKEEQLLNEWLLLLPKNKSLEMKKLFSEMHARESMEAKIYKAIDSLEALIQHNLSDLATWSEHEKDFNLTYGDDKVQFSNYFKELREEIREDTLKKLVN